MEWIDGDARSVLVHGGPDGERQVIAEIVKRRTNHYDLVDYHSGKKRIVETGLLDIRMSKRMYDEVLAGDL